MTRTRPNLRVLGYIAMYRGNNIVIRSMYGSWYATTCLSTFIVPPVVTGDTEVEALDAACDLIDETLGPERAE
jgi:hypothetical protein